MDHDPILYALRDRVSWAIGLAVLAVMLLARTGLGRS